MTMEGMNSYLIDRGFKVNRRRENGVYVFTITKNGITTCGEFKYPESDDWRYKNHCMQEFLDTLIMDNDRLAGKERSIEFKFDPTSLISKETLSYIKADLHATYGLYRDVFRRPSFAIKNVIHNDPATIVFWADGTKTVVKAQPGDTYDPEKGLAMAISKKALGNKGNYCNVFHKWLPDPEVEPIHPNIPFEPLDLKKTSEAFAEYLERKFGKKNETSDA